MPGAELLKQALKPTGEGHGRHTLVRDLDANVDHLNELLGYQRSYDVILRRLRIAGVDVAAYVINGFFNTLDNMELLRKLAAAEPHGPVPPPPDQPGDEPVVASGEIARRSPVDLLRSLLTERLSYSQVRVVRDFDEAVTQLLSGPMIILVDGEAAVIVVDTRTYPDRQPSTPNVEKLLRGPQDGFVENIIYNTALIRRRIRDPGLRFEMISIGLRGKTDVAIAYIEGLTDARLVREVRRRLRAVNVDAIPMAEEPVAEALGRQPWNPFPTARMTERPDVAATELLDGHVVVVVDTTPVAVSVPISLFQLLQHPEDYHVSPVFGTWLRWVEWYAITWAVLVPPFWLLLATHAGIRAAVPALSFLGPKQSSPIPLPLQFILAEFSIDVLRRAILNSATALATSFGILGAVILGQVATKVGLFTPEALVYMVGAAIASFAVSNLELGMALRMIRVSLVALEWLWALPGILVGLLFWLVLAARTDSLGTPYLWPLAPFDGRAMRSVFLREPAGSRAPRPWILHPQNRGRGNL